MTVQTLPEHQWLQKLLGEWTFETEAGMPGEAAERATGTESVRAIGDVWTAFEGRGEVPGCGMATTVMTLGYDPRKQRFVGTYVSSMMTYLWHYEGELSADGTTLTLNSEGPDCMVEGKIAKYQDIIEIKSDDHRIFRSQTPGEDGEWHCFMVSNYHRVK